jgi:hypothetical protein
LDFYKKSLSKNPYDIPSDGFDEPEIRSEIKKILFNEKRGSVVIYRRVRRDLAGLPILSDSTLSNRSGEATYGTNKGMKYIFDDHLVTGYMSQGSTFHDTGVLKGYGDSRTDKNTFYLEHDVLKKITLNNNDFPDEFDKILVPKTDLDGNLVSPLKCYLKYNIGSCEPYRLDRNRQVEFFKINLISNMDDSIIL